MLDYFEALVALIIVFLVFYAMSPSVGEEVPPLAPTEHEKKEGK